MKHLIQNILCIDDEPDVLSVAKMCLETVGGFTVTTAMSGLEGIEIAKNIQLDVILVDVMMPEMDGPETLKQLRKSTKLDDVPIIFMTARVRPTEVEQYLALGANGVVPKPFDPMDISRQITEISDAFHTKFRQFGFNPRTG